MYTYIYSTQLLHFLLTQPGETPLHYACKSASQAATGVRPVRNEEHAGV